MTEAELTDKLSKLGGHLDLTSILSKKNRRLTCEVEYFEKSLKNFKENGKVVNVLPNADLESEILHNFFSLDRVDFTKFIEENKDRENGLSTSFMETILFLSHIIFQNGSKHATYLIN